MPQMEDMERHCDQAQARIRATVMNEFCEVMHGAGLPPMTVMRLIALAVGSVYREVADNHSGLEACPCGWRPHEGSDIDLMCAALMTECRRHRRDLRVMHVAGTA